MDLSTVKHYIGLQLDGWAKTSPLYCPISAHLDDFKKTSGLLGACGRYIRELDSAITVADNAFQDLKEARERSVALFKEEDLSLPTDELHHHEAKAAGLQYARYNAK
jgi:hypothetical protein